MADQVEIEDQEEMDDEEQYSGFTITEAEALFLDPLYGEGYLDASMDLCKGLQERVDAAQDFLSLKIEMLTFLQERQEFIKAAQEAKPS